MSQGKNKIKVSTIIYIPNMYNMGSNTYINTYKYETTIFILEYIII